MQPNEWRTIRNALLITLTLILAFLIGPLTAIGTAFAPVAYAETPEHLYNRVLSELEAQHPDVLAACDPSVWVRNEPFLFPLARMLRQPPGRVACAFGVWKYERGIQFENVYGHPPTPYNWVYEYADDQEAFRALFNVGYQVFAVNEWTERRYFRYTWAFCIEELRFGAKCW